MFLVLIAKLVVASFHLHYLGHRIKYGNLVGNTTGKVENATQQLLSTTRSCFSIEFIESFFFWVILVTYNIGLYICLYIYKVSYIHSFFVMFIWNVFSALQAKHFEMWISILWKWWVDCFIAQSIRCCDISGCSQWIHFPFYGVFFFLRKLYFLLSPCVLLIAESISLDASSKPTVGFF